MTGRDHFWRKIPPASRAVFLLGVFFIFGIIGSAVDTISLGLQPIGRFLISIVLFGLFAMVYAVSGIFWRWRSGIIIPVVVLVEMVVMGYILQPLPAPAQMGTAEISHLQSRLALDAGMTIGCMVLAYVSFIYVFVSEGRRFFKVHAEMELAGEIHRVLVPAIETKIGDFEFYGRSVPSGQVGGDLIDLVQHGEKWIAYIADVSGHGVAPGVLMGMVKSAARMYLSCNDDSAGFLDRLNSVLHPIRKPEMFVTLAFLAWDGMQLTFSTAGHPPILQCCLDNRACKELLCSNMPLGLFAPNSFSVETVPLCDGALFLLCTDGLLEATNKSGAEFGMEGMRAVLSSAEHQSLKGLADTVFERTKSFGHTDDDESLLLIRCPAKG
ncbi:MAG TPA: PP2C family protein-serine/threonine phosphatase [Candidatus Binatia bacterium]|nr:PP2C family protein-serine/threonine phosphatase [Candidatus Binatia bacterium]